jgi:hypothetical protein
MDRQRKRNTDDRLKNNGDNEPIEVKEDESGADDIGDYDTSFVDEDLKRWVAEKHGENEEYIVYLYKYDNPVTGKQKSLCEQYTNEIPDVHTIGLTHGSGRYLLLIAVHKDGKRSVTNTRYIRLHKHYDELKNKNQLSGQSLQPVHVVNNQDSMEYAFKMFQAVINTLTPLIARGNTPAVDPMQQALSAYALTKNVLKDSLHDTQDLYKDFARKQLELGEGNMAIDNDLEFETVEEKSLLEKILPLAEAFIPLLLKNNVQARAASATIRALPQFKQVINSPQLRKIIEYVDKREGAKKADIILKNLGITRPGNKTGLTNKLE